jgi:hypothetical protein
MKVECAQELRTDTHSIAWCSVTSAVAQAQCSKQRKCCNNAATAETVKYNVTLKHCVQDMLLESA